MGPEDFEGLILFLRYGGDLVGMVQETLDGLFGWETVANVAAFFSSDWCLPRRVAEGRGDEVLREARRRVPYPDLLRGTGRSMDPFPNFLVRCEAYQAALQEGCGFFAIGSGAVALGSRLTGQLFVDWGEQRPMRLMVGCVHGPRFVASDALEGIDPGWFGLGWRVLSDSKRGPQWGGVPMGWRRIEVGPTEGLTRLEVYIPLGGEDSPLEEVGLPENVDRSFAPLDGKLGWAFDGTIPGVWSDLETVVRGPGRIKGCPSSWFVGARKLLGSESIPPPERSGDDIPRHGIGLGEGPKE